jgi:hypothetical protein
MTDSPDWTRSEGVGHGTPRSRVQIPPEDRFHHRLRQGLGTGSRPTGARLEGRLSFFPIAGDKPADPTRGNTVGAGYLCLLPTLDDNSRDDQSGF